MLSRFIQALSIPVLGSALALAAASSGCRQPSPAVPTEVEIEWPDAAPMALPAPDASTSEAPAPQSAGSSD